MSIQRRLPVGADLQRDGGVHFRVWAPRAVAVDVVLDAGAGDRRTIALEREADGYHAGLVAGAGAGSLYWFQLDGGPLCPDPASRFQPRGVHGPSQVIDPTYRWVDANWRGIGRDGQVLYELHVGTFTSAGTWSSASDQLPMLVDTGVTVIQMMPVAEFGGRFGWGYDGVDLFAPTRLYGQPDDLRRFVDLAHAQGLGVILDVVYNHVGPDGNYLGHFSSDYFTDRYQNEWGAAINFDGAGSAWVREFILSNARYWIEEYHFDGLRLDAAQTIFDASPVNIISEVARVVRDAARGRETLLIAEDESQNTRLVRPSESGGFGLDALYNDDFHHAARVAATGNKEGYYAGFNGTPQEFVSALRYGYLYQGQYYSWQRHGRGTPALDLPPSTFVHYLQNHDQVANSATGERLHQLTSRGRYRALTTLLLLAPQTPLLFQGQEFAASSPFLYFADHEAELAERVRAGRAEFLSQFESLAQPSAQALLPDPADPASFERSKLDHAERSEHASAYALCRDLLALRRRDPTFRTGARPEGAVLGELAFVMRWVNGGGADRLLVVNLGHGLSLTPAPEPLLAPPLGLHWETMWSSENERYGGSGSVALETAEGWVLPAEAAVVLRPVRLASQTIVDP